jgi:hypothetical protein
MEESIAGTGPNNLLDLLPDLPNMDKKSANPKKSDKLAEWIL